MNYILNHTHRLAAAALIAGFAATTTFSADPSGVGSPKKAPVHGEFDFAIVPPNLGPYIVAIQNNEVFVRHLPLVGNFSFTANGKKVLGKIHIDLNGELDTTGTGVVWTPITITGTVEGVRTILFEGTGIANEVNLVAIGDASLQGRGPYLGTEMKFVFQETGPGDSNTFTFVGTLSPAPAK